MSKDPFDVKPSEIFVKREVLKPSFLPDVLPEREKEIEELKWHLKDALQGSAPNNIFIYGKSGVGKTACCRKVLLELEKKTNELKITTVKTKYINCSLISTEGGILTDIANFFTQSEIAPRTGWAISDYYKFFAKTLDCLGGTFIIVLDEIDKLVPKSQNLLYNITRAREHLLTKASISIIGISNDVKFYEEIDSRIKSSLCQREIVINPYDSIQLKKILTQRVALAFHRGTVEKSAIALCAALAAREHGDARKALDLLTIAGEVAEKKSAKKVSEEHVKIADDIMEKKVATKVIEGLPLHSKILLLSIIQNGKGIRKITTGTVYDTYRSLCSGLGVSVLTQRRLSDLISELHTSRIISAEERSFGRGKGISREIELSIPLECVESALFQDESLAQLKNYEGRKWF